MYTGRYLKPRNRSAGRKRSLLAMAALALILTTAIGGTVAFLAAGSTQVKNLFRPVQVSCEALPETNSASVKNTGDVDAWIRAYLVINWMDANGNVYAIRPQAEISYNQNWKTDGKIRYYTKTVASGETVSLADSITVVGTGPEGYVLSVEVVAEAIQAEGAKENGTKAVADAWGLDPSVLK
jgi:hypothetical protein